MSAVVPRLTLLVSQEWGSDCFRVTVEEDPTLLFVFMPQRRLPIFLYSECCLRRMAWSSEGAICSACRKGISEELEGLDVAVDAATLRPRLARRWASRNLFDPLTAELASVDLVRHLDSLRLPTEGHKAPPEKVRFTYEGQAARSGS